MNLVVSMIQLFATLMRRTSSTFLNALLGDFLLRWDRYILQTFQCLLADWILLRNLAGFARDPPLQHTELCFDSFLMPL